MPDPIFSAPKTPDNPITPEAFYRALSPQLAARIRQLWSARGLDLDRIWLETIGSLPGFTPLAPPAASADSRAYDGLCLFDQALIWLQGLIRLTRAGISIEGLVITAPQLRAIATLGGRMIETLGAIRMLILGGYTTPALQLSRSVSEDVDMVMALLLRPKLAERFLACRSSDEANDFWRRHIAGGRAFRLVAEQLYAIGLDHTDHSPYGLWRREVLKLLGAAIHSSPLGQSEALMQSAWPDQPVARDCLEFLTWRLHELCAWAHLLDLQLEADLTLIARRAPATSAAEQRLFPYAAQARDILLDQLRWTVARDDEGGQGEAGFPLTPRAFAGGRGQINGGPDQH